MGEDKGEEGISWRQHIATTNSGSGSSIPHNVNHSANGQPEGIGMQQHNVQVHAFYLNMIFVQPPLAELHGEAYSYIFTKRSINISFIIST